MTGKYFGSNGASVKGPVIANYGEIDGDGKSKAFVTVPGRGPGRRLHARDSVQLWLTT